MVFIKAEIQNLDFLLMHLKQSKNWGNYLETLGWESSYIPQAVRIKPLLFWSVIKIQRPEELSEDFFRKVDILAKEHKALFVKIEPDVGEDKELFSAFKYKKSREILSFSKTEIVDLAGSLGAVLKNCSKDTRQRIKKLNGACHVEISELTSYQKLKDFYGLFCETARHKKFWAPSFSETNNKAKAFGKNGFLAVAYQNEKPAAAAFVLCEGDTAYYEHAAHSPKVLGDYPYIVLWNAIKECKRRKMSFFDLCGVYDERFKRATKKWKKFSVFKRKWGGEEKSYPFSYVKNYSPFWFPFFLL